MCGIIGIIANKPVSGELIAGLQRLEYRGYDSAGIATLSNGHIDRRRAEGKLCNLVARLEREPVQGTIGIGHTRWATHGHPTETNAHPIAHSSPISKRANRNGHVDISRRIHTLRQLRGCRSFLIFRAWPIRVMSKEPVVSRRPGIRLVECCPSTGGRFFVRKIMLELAHGFCQFDVHLFLQD